MGEIRLKLFLFIYLFLSWIVQIPGVKNKKKLKSTAQEGWLGLGVGGHLALSLHSSSELGELSQWL